MILESASDVAAGMRPHMSNVMKLSPKDKVMRIQSYLQRLGTEYDRPVSLCIQFLIVLTMIAFSIETLPDLSPQTRSALALFEVVSVAIFSIEYVVRLYAAENRIGFITSFFGVVDLLAIMPFYLSFGIDLRSIRVLRLFRLFRVLKLARYNKAIHRFQRAIIIAREEIILFFVLSMIMLYLSAVGLYYFEHDAQPVAFASIFHALWWAVVTLTTVGYGDAYPITIGGRIFTFLILLVGLGVIAVPTGIITSSLQQARDDQLNNPNEQDIAPEYEI